MNDLFLMLPAETPFSKNKGHGNWLKDLGDLEKARKSSLYSVPPELLDDFHIMIERSQAYYKVDYAEPEE